MREGVLEKRGTLEKGSAMGVCSHSGVECMGGFEPGNVDFASAKYLDGGGFGSVWRVGGEYAAKPLFFSDLEPAREEYGILLRPSGCVLRALSVGFFTKPTGDEFPAVVEPFVMGDRFDVALKRGMLSRAGPRASPTSSRLCRSL